MSFGRRWRPNARQRQEYAAKMREAEEMFDFIRSAYPIREGCFVRWVDKSTNDIYEGNVKRSTYGSDNQHTFTIALENGKSKRVKGRNLYDRLLEHEAGEIARDKNHPLNNRKIVF